MIRQLLIAALLASGATPLRAQEDPALEEARQVYLSLDDEAALNKINAFMASNPFHLAGSILRARLLNRLGNFPEAVRTMEQLPDPPVVARLLLAESLALSGDFERANEIIDAVLLEDASLESARVARARALMLQGRYSAALSELQLVLQGNPRNADANVTMAMAFEGLRKFQEAKTMYSRFIGAMNQFEPHDPHLQRDSMEGLGRTSMALGQVDEAIGYYQQLTNVLPHVPLYWFRLGIAQGSRNKFADALKNIEKAVEMAPAEPNFRLRLAEMYYAATEYDKAIEQYEELIEKTSDPRLPLLRLAELHLEKNDLNRAASYAKAAYELEPNSADILEVLGGVRERLGETDAAIEAYRQAFELNSMKYQSMFRLGTLLRKKGSEAGDEAMEAEGLALLNRYNRIVPMLGDIDALRSEVNMNPSNPAPQLKMMAVLNEVQEYETAIRWAGQCLKLAPQNPQVLAVAGCIAANSGQNQRALEFFQQSQALLPTPDEKLQGYIDTLQAGGTLPLPLGSLFRTTDPTQKDG